MHFLLFLSFRGQELVPGDKVTLEGADASVISTKEQSQDKPLDSFELLITDVRSESPVENLEDSDADPETPVSSIPESSCDSASEHQTEPENMESGDKLLSDKSHFCGNEDVSDDLKIVNVISMVGISDEETVDGSEPQKETENEMTDNTKDNPQKETENEKLDNTEDPEDNTKDPEDSNAPKDQDSTEDSTKDSKPHSDTEYDYHCHATVSLIRKIGTNLVEFVYDEVFVEIASSTNKNSTVRNKSPTVDKKRNENKPEKDQAEQKEINSVTEKGDNKRQNAIEELGKGSQSNMKETGSVAEQWDPKPNERLDDNKNDNKTTREHCTSEQDGIVDEPAKGSGVRDHANAESCASNDTEINSDTSRKDTTSKTDGLINESVKGTQVHDDHVNVEAGASNDTENNNKSSIKNTTPKMDDIFDEPVEGREVHGHADPETCTSNDTENNNESSRIAESIEGREEHDHSNAEVCASNDLEKNKKSSMEDTTTMKMDGTNDKPVELSDTNQGQIENKEMIDFAKLVELQSKDTNKESIVNKNEVVSTPALKRTAPVFGATDSVDSCPSSVTPLSDNVATDASNDVHFNSEPPFKRPRLMDTAAHKEIPPNVRHHDEKVEITEETIRSDASFETGDIQDDSRSFAPVQRSKSEVAKSLSDAQAELDKVCEDFFTDLQPVPLPEKGSHTCNICEESFYTSWDRRYVNSEADLTFPSC